MMPNAPVLAQPPATITWRLLLWVSLAHLSVDTAATFLTPLLPELEKRYLLSAVQMGLLLLTVQVTTAFTQPFWGLVSDRIGKGTLVVWGPVLAICMIGMVGLAPGYAGILLLVAVAGCGVAAFHPEGAALAASASGAKKAMGMAVFVVAGHFGLALGPSLAGQISERLGLHYTWLIIPPGLLLMLLVGRVLRPHARRMPTAPRGILRRALQTQAPLFGLIFAISVLRSFVHIMYASGMPFWWDGLGLSASEIGLLSGTFLFSGGLVGFACGMMQKPGGEKPWIVWGFILAIPCFYLLPRLGVGMLLPFAVFAAGATLNATVPVVVVYAQRLLPGAESMAAALVLGLSWGVGGAVGSVLLRYLQKLYGNATVLQYAAWALVPALVCAILLPASRALTPAASPPEAPT
jgi:MFS transporter, FSR family, fosmidomycin resistance protein